jgi:hypothetical protein
MSALPTKPRQERQAIGASWSDRSIAEQFGLGPPQPRVAVLIPCHNEAFAIGTVVTDFHRHLPDAEIYVYDNNSSDQTMHAAEAAGAIVRRERLQGKGHVVRRMFADVEADVYILVDGDDTYDAAAAPAMLDLLLQNQLDMVSAARQDTDPNAYRFGHRFGNRMLTRIVARVFGHGISDLLSGYRVFSRRFVKSFPALSGGFETETEFTIHALTLCMPVQEIRAAYRGRPAGSRSKLNTVLDGTRILRTIINLVQHERPLQMYSFAGVMSLLAAIVLGLPVVTGFFETGLVPRLPTALLAASLVLLGFLSFTCGLVLDAVARGRKEARRLAYLAIPPLEFQPSEFPSLELAE